MAFRLIPREEKFFTDFQALADELKVGAQLLEQMLEPEHPVWNKADEIKEVEHKCDSLTHGIIQRLNRTFVTPLDREDIHMLATRLDNVVDLIDGTARRAQMFRLTDRREPAKQLVQLGVDGDVILGERVHLPPPFRAFAARSIAVMMRA